jgi:hypothetical protein
MCTFEICLLEKMRLEGLLSCFFSLLGCPQAPSTWARLAINHPSIKKHAASPAIQLREKESHDPQSPNNGSISSSVRFVIHGGVTSNTTK